MKTFGFILTILLLSTCYAATLGPKAKERLAQPHTLGEAHTIPNLTVHLIAHTHDDVGWLKTVDQYYYGDRNDNVWVGVRYILSSVIPQLIADPTKKFIYVEMAFFWRWWNEQTPEMKKQVQKLVENGQLEFINAGWSMNDEACVYYEDTIDNMYLGHQFVKNNFNVTPTVAWHIDPFGHAAAQASLYSQMGFNAFYFARVDYQDKGHRIPNKAMEMVWQPPTSQGSKNNIFAAINYNHYSSPPHFNFDIRDSDTPVMGDPALEDYNLDMMAELLVSYFVDMANAYKSDQLLHTVGQDFNFQAANVDFMNWDTLMNYISTNPDYANITFKYSTPQTYLTELYSKEIDFPYKYDDFFPYADEEYAYWTGYFTSRVSMKGYVRRTGKLLQAMKKLITEKVWRNESQWVVDNWHQVDTALNVLEMTMGILQHHDAVAGTSQQAVAYDYYYRMWNATKTVLENLAYPIISEDIQKSNMGITVPPTAFTQCNTNVSTDQCTLYNYMTENGTVLVTLYNPTQNDRAGTVARVKVPSSTWTVTDADFNPVASIVTCANETSTTDCDAFFNVTTLNPFDFSYYYLLPETSAQTDSSVSFLCGTNQTFVINPNQKLTTDCNNFYLTYCPEVEDASSCYETAFTLSYDYYVSYQCPDNSWDCHENSGAYLFRPNNTYTNDSYFYSTPVFMTYWHSQGFMTQITLTHNGLISTNVRVYNDLTSGIEVETFVNSIPIEDGHGKEVIMKVTSQSINNNETFYTDSMGMEMLPRVLNYRPSWKYEMNSPVTGNYYPINSAIYVEDVNTGERLTVSNDRAQGGSSIHNGEVEIMIHRRLLFDDERGVIEPLNETDWDGQGLRQYMTHHIQFSKPGVVESAQRQIQFDQDQPTQIFLAPVTLPDMQLPIQKARTSIHAFMPEVNTDSTNLVKVTTRTQTPTTHVVRFHNMDDAVTVNIPVDVFTSAHTETPKVTEMSLTANQPLEQMIKNKYNWNNYTNFNEADVPTDYINGPTFTLLPQQIRTFLVEFPTTTVTVQKETTEYVKPSTLLRGN